MFVSTQRLNESTYKVPVSQILKPCTLYNCTFYSKPDQPGLSSSIRLEVPAPWCTSITTATTTPISSTTTTTTTKTPATTIVTTKKGNYRREEKSSSPWASPWALGGWEGPGEHLGYDSRDRVRGPGPLRGQVTKTGGTRGPKKGTWVPGS